jgi:hypothetical protein
MLRAGPARTNLETPPGVISCAVHAFLLRGVRGNRLNRGIVPFSKLHKQGNWACRFHNIEARKTQKEQPVFSSHDSQIVNFSARPKAQANKGKPTLRPAEPIPRSHGKCVEARGLCKVRPRDSTSRGKQYFTCSAPLTIESIFLLACVSGIPAQPARCGPSLRGENFDSLSLRT